jgi:hypothetical protein
LQMMPKQVALFWLWQKQQCSTWKELIWADRRMINTVATALGCSYDIAYSIMHGHLKFQKVCAQWVLRELKDREEIKRMGLSLQHL